MAQIPASTGSVRAVVPEDAVYDQNADQSGGGGGRANKTLSSLLKAVDNIQVHNQHDLYEVLEAIRQLGTYAAVQAGCLAHEVDAGARAMAKAESTLGIVGLGIRARIRSVVKDIEGCANGFMQSAGSAVKARHKMEAILDEINGAQKPKQAKGFTIQVDR